jgi:hypothetical protein
MSYITALITFLIILGILIVALWGPNWYYREKPKPSTYKQNFGLLQDADERQGRSASSLLHMIEQT